MRLCGVCTRGVSRSRKQKTAYLSSNRACRLTRARHGHPRRFVGGAGLEGPGGTWGGRQPDFEDVIRRAECELRLRKRACGSLKTTWIERSLRNEEEEVHTTDDDDDGDCIGRRDDDMWRSPSR